jgi:hypothetical protein
VTTYQAYNPYGGYSFYTTLDGGGPTPTRVSFDRPYANGQGTGQFYDAYLAFYPNPNDEHSWPAIGFEYPMVRFLEREGYDVTYATDIDLHANPNVLANRNAFLSVGHDEYWSKDMHDNLERKIDGGTHVAFFSGNSVYWIIKLQQSSALVPNRIIETHKDPEDGGTQNIPNPWLWQNCALPAGPFSAPRCNDTGEQSEQTLVGSITTDGNTDRGDIVFSDSDFTGRAGWVLQNTGLDGGSRLPGMIGYEAQSATTLTAQFLLGRRNSRSLNSRPVPIPTSPNSSKPTCRYTNRRVVLWSFLWDLQIGAWGSTSSTRPTFSPPLTSAFTPLSRRSPETFSRDLEASLTRPR